MKKEDRINGFEDMIRMHDAGGRGIDEAIARKMIEAIDAGLYRIEPRGPERIGIDGTRRGCPSEWTEQDIDLAEAVSLLKWHPGSPEDDAEHAREGVPRTGPTTDALPDIRLGDGLRMWTSHSDICSGRPIMERILACEPMHLAIARKALASPPCDEGAIECVRRDFSAVAASTLLPEERTMSLLVRAGNAWVDTIFEVMGDDDETRPIAESPSSELTDLLPRCIMVRGGLFQEEDPVVIDDFECWIEPEDMPDAIEIIRTISQMRMRSG